MDLQHCWFREGPKKVFVYYFLLNSNPTDLRLSRKFTVFSLSKIMGKLYAWNGQICHINIELYFH